MVLLFTHTFSPKCQKGNNYTHTPQQLQMQISKYKHQGDITLYIAHKHHRPVLTMNPTLDFIEPMLCRIISELIKALAQLISSVHTQLPNQKHNISTDEPIIPYIPTLYKSRVRAIGVQGKTEHLRIENTPFSYKAAKNIFSFSTVKNFTAQNVKR